MGLMAKNKEEDARRWTDAKQEPIITNVIPPSAVGLVRTVVSISHCGCDDPGSIPGLDKAFCFFKNHNCMLLVGVGVGCYSVPYYLLLAGLGLSIS